MLAQEAALVAVDLSDFLPTGFQVYREVPQKAPPPYVVIGADEIEPIGDPDCGEAHTIVSTVQWWTKGQGGVPGSAIVRRMGAAFLETLLTGVVIDGHQIVLAETEAPTFYATDPDGSSRGRAVIRYETTSLT